MISAPGGGATGMGGAELGKMAMRAGNGRRNVERGLGKIAETAGGRGAGRAVFSGKNRLQGRLRPVASRGKTLYGRNCRQIAGMISNEIEEIFESTEAQRSGG